MRASIPAACRAACTGEHCELRDTIGRLDDSDVQLCGTVVELKAALRTSASSSGSAES